MRRKKMRKSRKANATVNVPVQYKDGNISITVNIKYGDAGEEKKKKVSGTKRRPRCFRGGSLGERLTYARERKGLTRTQALAELHPMVISPHTLKRYEDGITIPCIEVVEKLAEIYGCKVENLVAKDEMAMVKSRRTSVGVAHKRRKEHVGCAIEKMPVRRTYRAYYPTGPIDLAKFVGWCFINMNTGAMDAKIVDDGSLILTDVSDEMFRTGMRSIGFNGTLEAVNVASRTA